MSHRIVSCVISLQSCISDMQKAMGNLTGYCDSKEFVLAAIELGRIQQAAASLRDMAAMTGEAMWAADKDERA